MRRLLALAALAVAALAAAPALAQQPEPRLPEKRAAKFVRNDFPSWAAEVLLKDQRSQVYVAAGRAKVRDTVRVDRSSVDVAYRIRLIEDPETENTIRYDPIVCTGSLHVRNLGPRLNGRLRDYSCRSVPPAEQPDA